MRHWLSRFSFSLLALAFLLGYTGYRAAAEGTDRWHVVPWYVGAAASTAAGLAGLRERHRR
jgi:hypothetical protein